MQAPGGPDEDRSGGFSYGGWIANYWDDTMSSSSSRRCPRPVFTPQNYETGAPIHLGSLALEPNKQELDRREKIAREG